jgi:hypothetical protein
MLDGLIVHFLDNFGVTGDDVKHSYTAGFRPTNSQRFGEARSAPSLDPLSVVAPTDTYFIGNDPYGRRFFSRNGAFKLIDGQLRTQNGQSEVLGYMAGQTGLVPLRVDPKDKMLNRASDVQIEADGSLSYMRSLIDPKTGQKKKERVVAGRIALAQFPGGTQLSAADGVHITPPYGIEPTLGKPNEPGFLPLQTKRVDRGQIDLKRSLQMLRDSYIEFDVFRVAGRAKGHNEDKVIALIK